METITILLFSFVLSVTGLFVFIWSLRKKLFDDNPAAANVIFSEGEIGRIEEPAATPAQRASLQKTVDATHLPLAHAGQEAALKEELEERLQADRSTALVTFVFLSCAVVWLVLASVAGFR